jgi:hypothetical protein
LTANETHAREELARSLWDSYWEGCPQVEWEADTESYRDEWRRVADTALADFARLAGLLGYVKADGWSWGVYHPEGDYTDLYDDEATAREMQEALGGKLVRCPQIDWEVVSDADTQK